MGCATFPKSSSKLPPDILIVLDASGSMNEDQTNTSCGNQGCGATSKWALMVPAINQVVTDTQTEVNWGLKFFADSGSCGVNNNAAVPIAAMNRDRDSDRHHRPHVCERRRVERQLDADARRRERRGHLPQRRWRRRIRTPSSSCWRRTASRTVRHRAAVGRRLAGRDRRGHRRGDGRYPDVRRRHRDRRRHGRDDAELDGGRGRLPAGGRGDAVLRCVGYGRVRRGVAHAGRDGDDLPVLDSDAADDRRHDQPRGHPGHRRHRNAPDTTIPQDATNGWTYTDTTHTSITLHGSSCDAVTAGTITTVTIVFNCHVP